MNHLYSAKRRKPRNYIPTILIMCVVLFSILYFGEKISTSVAGIFANESQDIDTITEQYSTSGGDINKAFVTASRHILHFLSQPDRDSEPPKGNTHDNG